MNRRPLLEYVLGILSGALVGGSMTWALFHALERYC